MEVRDLGFEVLGVGTQLDHHAEGKILFDDRNGLDANLKSLLLRTPRSGPRDRGGRLVRSHADVTHAVIALSLMRPLTWRV